MCDLFILTVNSIYGKYWDHYHQIGPCVYKGRGNYATRIMHGIAAQHPKNKADSRKQEYIGLVLDYYMRQSKTY